MSEKIYKAAQEAGAQGAADGAAPEANPDGNVYEADYKDVDDTDKK